MNIRSELDKRIAAALVAAGAPEGTLGIVTPPARPEFGDYQANGVMGAAKKMKTNPRRLAEAVAAAVDFGDLAEPPEVAGPGFLNIRLKTDWLAARAAAMAADTERLGVAPAEPAQTVVVDYSSPNLAKEMHVGHLRSTIIGDALARVLDFLGHHVIRQNHVGDWGTQFGMLLAYLDRTGAGMAELADLEKLYRQAKQLFDADPDFADTARQFVVKLQGGDAHCLEMWRQFLAESLRHCAAVYERLGVLLTEDDVRGESAYNDDLANVIADLETAGLIRETEGAKGVFLEGYANRDGEPLPMLVEKSGGGYLYATTDLAAVRFRAGKGKADGVVDWVADRVLYVTDSRQAQHFEMMFKAAKLAGFAPESMSLEHVGFGMMMGEDNRPFKTRQGGTVKLADLLDEAQARALELVTQLDRDRNERLDESDRVPMAPAQREAIARAVGIGAVKYADLSHNRTSDYVFRWDQMLALEGNTAPYMQYAYARVRSIFRKGELTDADAAGARIALAEPAERALALKLAQLPEAVETVAAECTPHVLCAYLYDLAGAFMSFYEQCPVLKADAGVRASRLSLARLTADVIGQGLALLGIETLEQM